jgi:diaminohydroxyphosphoribosylaminopyrimidine deaminase/5-amino-6-(5-phosphoribosylamino)uracil reductase
MTGVATEADRVHLRRAIEIARRGRGRVSPNPMVGAVIARAGETIGEGWHQALGESHAEVAALADCRARGNDPAGATLYVSLEPCAHHGRQPPCTEAILAAGIARVVIGCEDPTEKASGRGPGVLRDEGVDVAFADGSDAAAARLLNQAFLKHARTGRPHVVYKAAVSLDGHTATAGGDSRWISSATSRALVHRWRADADAVAVGIGTALADDPLLTARTETTDPAAPGREAEEAAGSGVGASDEVRQPTRIVFDSSARLPLESKLIESVSESPVIVVTASGAASERLDGLRGAGAEVLAVDGDAVRRVTAALGELGARGITSLLLEGGAELAGSFMAAGEVDELRMFIAPVLLGGGRPLIAGQGAETVAAAQRPLATEFERSGEDLLVRARMREW